MSRRFTEGLSFGESDGETEIEDMSLFIVGWRLHIITLGLLLSLFMSQTESTILSTSIVTITNDLGGYGKSSWVFTAYFVTYSGLLIIWAKLSDIFGRKLLLVVALLLFIIFSAACGASQTFLELIMFRWVLGFGGSGIYSIATLVFFELVPPSKYADYVALVTAVIALSVVSGPLLGGAISSHGRWRWVFLLNVPIGSVALLLLMLIMPKRLRTEPSAAGDLISSRHGFAPRTLKRIDFLGGFLLLGANVLIVTALEQATAGVSFAAREILPLLILAAVLWCAFLLWQWYATAKCVSLEPVLPFRLLTNRVFLGMILNTFFTGTILAVCIVQLPQRFMTVNGESAFQAGLKLLPFGVFVPAGSSLAAILMGRARIRAEYVLVAGGILEIVGTILLSKTSVGLQIPRVQYGYQILTGTGVGFFNAALILLVPYVVEKRDLAVGTAAIGQFRILGGAVGLAIVTTIFNRSMRPKLLRLLLPAQVDALLEYTSTLATFPEATQLAVRSSLGEGFNLQMTVLIGFAAAQLPATLLMWKKKSVVVQ